MICRGSVTSIKKRIDNRGLRLDRYLPVCPVQARCDASTVDLDSRGPLDRACPNPNPNPGVPRLSWAGRVRVLKRDQTKARRQPGVHRTRADVLSNTPFPVITAASFCELVLASGVAAGPGFLASWLPGFLASWLLGRWLGPLSRGSTYRRTERPEPQL